MLLEAASFLQHALAPAANTPLGAIVFAMAYMTGILYLLWRLWTFTILPIVRPKDPRQLPYRIPGESDLKPMKLSLYRGIF